MSPVILSISLVLVVIGTLGVVFNKRVDLWMGSVGSRIFPDGFRDSFESAFGDPAKSRTALKVSVAFMLIGILMFSFGPVVS